MPTAAQQRAVASLLHVSPIVDDLGALLTAAGHEIALVGGSVRDALLGRLQQDLDFATDAPPQRVLESGTSMGGSPRGPASRTARSACARTTTSWRSRPTAAMYDPASRKPAVTYGDTLEGDLARRDFTVNAMAVPAAIPAVRRSIWRPA